MSLAPIQPNANNATLASIKERAKSLPPDTPLSFYSAGGFELMQRAALLLSRGTLLPEAYREEIIDKKTGLARKNSAALSNCVVALNMAMRLGADPLMIMQNLYIVEGRPAWSSQFVIASINSCGKFTPLRFDIENLGEKEVKYAARQWNAQAKRYEDVIRQEVVEDKSCVAWAIEKESGERIEGPRVSVEMAVKEGWHGKNGSKWKTMPEVMLRYRAASFFGKLYAPELLMGLQTAEEQREETLLMEAGEDGFALAAEAPGAKPASEGGEGDAAKAEAALSEKEKKRAVEKQRAAKIAERLKEEKDAGQGNLGEEIQAGPRLHPGDIKCPKGTDDNPRIVLEEDCEKCPDRNGCPEWGEDF